MVTELAKDCIVEEQDFEVGKSYSYYIRNKSDKPGQFTLSDYVSAYGGVQLVCTENGELPVVQVADDGENWRHGIMGNFEVARFSVEEGYYIIQVHTPDGFDVLLNGSTPTDPLVVVLRVEKLEELEVFGSTEMRVKAIHRFKASELTFLGELTAPIMTALERVS